MEWCTVIMGVCIVWIDVVAAMSDSPAYFPGLHGGAQPMMVAASDPNGAQARVILVDDDGPADFSRIQAAIDAAGPGDMVKVAPGTYREAVRMKAGVSLQGAGPADTVIDVPTHVPVVTAADDCRLDGFTITGYIDDDIDGVYCQDVNDFTISNNVIKDCTWSGINAIRSSIVVRNNIICGNRCAGIFLTSSSATRSIIVNNTIWGNANEADVTIWRGAEALVVNNIMEDIDCDAESFAKVLYNDIAAQAADANNIQVDPLFADPRAGDWHLKSRAGRWDPGSKIWVQDETCSPCIDAGDPNSPVGDEPQPNGGRINMGAYGGTREASKSCLVQPPRTIIYVDDDAPGLNNGSSWQKAYKYLQDALADVNEADKPVEIRVAQGAYKPHWSSVHPAGTGDRDASFRLVNGVALRGGYAGMSVGDPNARDIAAYGTILTGDTYDNDTEIAYPTNAAGDRDFTQPLTLAMLLMPSWTDNSLHVVIADAIDESAVLDGFTITHGYADDPVGQPYVGGGAGLYCLKASPAIVNCTFTHNLAPYGGGAGVASLDGSPVVTRCTFTDNLAIAAAGFVCSGPGRPVVMECTFSGNIVLGSTGGAVGCFDEAQARITNCLVTANHSEGGGGGITCIYSPGVIENCLIIGNSTGIRGYGAGVYFGGDRGKPPRLTNCVISGNSAGAGGGGVFCGVSNAMIEDCTISGNSARGYNGGGIYCGGASPTIRNCLIVGNSTAFDGGGIHCFSGAMGQSRPNVVNCTIADNTAGRGGGGVSCENSSQLKAMNSIIWGNSGSYAQQAYLRPGGALLTLSYCDVQGAKTGVEILGSGTLTWGPGNIDADPCFASSGPSDANESVVTKARYHLKSQGGRWDPNSLSWVKDDVTSPCIDAGDPNSPIGLEALPNGGRINMGAYGGTTEASKSWLGDPVSEAIIAGDAGGDCLAGFADLSIRAP